ncbi:MAG: DbpA RNA binding domain-containing protein, partial [Muribaculaceae bacterium]|nr:DbpA RNA binding domain-containing protein [Muribaculaceae bacterium]
GTLEQIEREKAVALFSNGTVIVMVATDLAARGLDITTVKHIIHYDLPLTQEIFIHRNGRTARVDSHGDVYLITTPHESLPSFASGCKKYEIMADTPHRMKVSNISTLYISAGRKEKVSRGDVVGFIVSHATMIAASEIGKINIYDHHCLVAVPKDKTAEIIKAVSSFKLKKLKVKVSVAHPRLRFAKPTNR